MSKDQLSEEAIFEQAFELESLEARLDYLKRVCRNDEQVERIQALLQEGAPEVSFLERGPANLQIDDHRPNLPKRIGDFEILGELGRGGMGLVYRARQCSLNRLVALKVLSAGLGLTTKAIMRFKLEAEAAAKLHHTNIVPIYWTGEENRVPYYAMELIDGPSLDQVIKQLRTEADTSSINSASDASRAQQDPDWINETLICNSAAKSDTATSSDRSTFDISSSLGSSSAYYDNLAKMMADVADALAHAHDHGIVHRDIKPANLLLSSDGRLSVNDFGLARMLEQPGMTMTGELMGSPMYMSPEQITAGRLPLDYRTDIYSLGATLYELLTLQPPFPGKQRDQVLSQVIHKDPPKPRSINPQIPRDLETICMKAMEKDPDRRYQTAELLAKDLRRFVDRHAISARRTGPLERAVRWARKNKALTAMASLTLLIGLVAAGFGYRHWNDRIEKQFLVDQLRAQALKQALDQALKKAMSGSFAKALLLIDEAIEHGADPNWKPMIEAQQDLFEGKAENAVAKLQNVVEKNSDNLTARWMLAEAYWANGQTMLTGTTIQDLNGEYPEQPLESLFAAKALSMAEPDKAMSLLNSVLREDPQLTYARITRAHVTVFQAMNKKDGDRELVHRALSDLQIASDFLEEEHESNPTLISSRLFAHLTAVHLCQREDDSGGAERHLKDARDDAIFLGENYPNYHSGNFSRLYYHQFKEEFDGMYEVMLDVIAHGHRGWIADPFWVTCYINPEWARWNPEWIYDNPLEMLNRMPHQDDDYVALGRLIFHLEQASSPQEVEEVFGDYYNQRAGESWDPVALLLTGQHIAASKYAEDTLDSIRTKDLKSKESSFLFSMLQFSAGEISEQEVLDRFGGSERDLVQARFSLGLRKLAEGKRDRAQYYFDEAVKGTMYCWTPFDWSSAFADRMKKDPGWPHWPMLSSPE